MTTSTRPSPTVHPTQLRAVWQTASLLIGYPDDALLARAGLLREVCRRLPADFGRPLLRFVDHLEATPLAQLAADYVATFDHRRRCCLFLTYFAHGDTRKRGAALLRFKQTYQAAGLVLTPEELPDHLSVVLEFGATADHLAAWDLLLDHRAGLELLRISLRDSGSPWTPVIETVTATLPPLRGNDADAVVRLAAAGPPDEEVGLAPFTPPGLWPEPGTRPGPVALPVPLPRPTIGGRA